MIRSIIEKTAVVLIGILVVLLGRGLFFYDVSDGYSAAFNDLPPASEYLVVPAAPSTGFTDVYEEGEGIILIDMAHANAFNKEEINVLTLRLISRGFTVRFLNVEDDLESELLGDSEEEDDLESGLLGDSEEEDDLESGLLGDSEEEEEPGSGLLGNGGEEEEPEEGSSGADAYIIISPQMEFFKEEVEIIDEFVEQGGKLLLIADPTRYSEMDSLSLHFGLIFEAGYLYNQVENETNYRNIFITEFEENGITGNLERIVLYTAGSISSAGGGIVFGDENTFSSQIETRTGLSPIAWVNGNKVLAIYDLTFIAEPYNGIYDNNQLISNIADWLTSPAEEEEEAG